MLHVYFVKNASTLKSITTTTFNSILQVVDAVIVETKKLGTQKHFVLFIQRSNTILYNRVLDIKVPDEIRNAYISVLSISLQYVVTNLCEIHETLSSTKDPGNLSSEEFLFLTPTTDTNFTLDNNFSLVFLF